MTTETRNGKVYRTDITVYCDPEYRIDEKECWGYAVSDQGFTGTLEDWLALPAGERQEYEDGAAGLPT